MAVEGLERCLKGLVGAVIDGVERLVAEDVACHQCLKVAQNQIAGLVDVVPSWSHAVLSGIVHKVVQQFIIVGCHAQELLIVIHLLEAVAVNVNIAESEFLHQSSIGDVDIVRRNAGGVAWHEDIRHNATAAIDSATCDQGGEDLRLVNLHAVLAIYLTVHVAIIQFFLIGHHAAFIILLDASTGRCIIAGDGQAYSTAVG